MTDRNLDKIAIAGSVLLNTLVFVAGYSSGYQSASEGAKDSAIHENQTVDSQTQMARK